MFGIFHSSCPIRSFLENWKKKKCPLFRSRAASLTAKLGNQRKIFWRKCRFIPFSRPFSCDRQGLRYFAKTYGRFHLILTLGKKVFGRLLPYRLRTAVRSFANCLITRHLLRHLIRHLKRHLIRHL